MPYAVVTGPVIPANADVILMGRIKSRSGEYISQSTISTIAWTLTDVSDGPNSGTTVASSTFTVSAVVFNSLQTDAFWTKDTTGYNFRGIITATNIPTTYSGDRLQADVKFTMTSGEVLRGQWNWPTSKTYG